MDNNEREIGLLQGLAVNNSEAVETIYKDNYQLIQKLVVHNNGSEDDAKDIFQESLIVLYERSKSGDFKLQCQIKTFLYAVARRLWLKKLQLNNQLSVIVETTETDIADVEADLNLHERKNAQFDTMGQSLAKLGEPCKSLIEAFYLQKRKMNEIAERFGYTNTDNAKNQKYKCLMRLRKIFFSQYKNGDRNG